MQEQIVIHPTRNSSVRFFMAQATFWTALVGRCFRRTEHLYGGYGALYEHVDEGHSLPCLYSVYYGRTVLNSCINRVAAHSMHGDPTR